MLPGILKEVRSQFPDIMLHIFGTGHDETALKEKFREANLTENVSWHGRFEVDKLPDEFASLDADRGSTEQQTEVYETVHRGSSAGANEDMRQYRGLTLIDPIDSGIVTRAKSSYRAMIAGMLGLPIVTSDIGIRPYLLPQSLHYRFFAKPATTADYTNKIISLIKDPLTADDKQNMRTHAMQFTWKTLAKKYEKIITE